MYYWLFVVTAKRFETLLFFLCFRELIMWMPQSEHGSGETWTLSSSYCLSWICSLPLLTLQLLVASFFAEFFSTLFSTLSRNWIKLLRHQASATWITLWSTSNLGKNYLPFFTRFHLSVTHIRNYVHKLMYFCYK